MVRSGTVGSGVVWQGRARRGPGMARRDMASPDGKKGN